MFKTMLGLINYTKEHDFFFSLKWKFNIMRRVIHHFPLDLLLIKHFLPHFGIQEVIL